MGVNPADEDSTVEALAVSDNTTKPSSFEASKSGDGEVCEKRGQRRSRRGKGRKKTRFKKSNRAASAQGSATSKRPTHPTNAQPETDEEGKPGEQAIAASNRRRSERLPLVARVVRTDGSPTYWQSIDLSGGGLFLTGTPLLKQGEEFELGLRLPENSQDHELTCRARVAWVRSSKRPTGHGDEMGMGIQFIGLSPEEDRFLRDYLVRRGANLTEQAPTSTRSKKKRRGEQGKHRRGRAPTLGAARLEKGSSLGSYRILDLLGTGGMSDVYLAQHIQLGRKVALKRLHSRFLSDTSIVNRFFDEARGISQITHDNIVAITDFISTEEHKCFVMEFIDGETLSDRLEREYLLPFNRVVHIGGQICDALDAIHRAGIIHRDLKPANIVLTERNGVRDCVKILDFGIAKFTEPTKGVAGQETLVGLTLGTPGYIAPEYILRGKVDHRVDIYALGVLLYQMVTGRRPFAAETWPQMLLKHAYESTPRPSKLTALPEELEAIILGCLAKEPRERFSGAGEVGERLRGLKHDPHALLSIPQTRERGKRWLLLVCVAIVLCGASLWWISGPQDDVEGSSIAPGTSGDVVKKTKIEKTTPVVDQAKRLPTPSQSGADANTPAIGDEPGSALRPANKRLFRWRLRRQRARAKRKNGSVPIRASARPSKGLGEREDAP